MSDAPFTKRLKAFGTRLAVDSSSGALYVKDQLLTPVKGAPVVINGVKPSGLGADIQRYMLQTLGVRPTLLTTVFAGLKNPGKFDDVAILKLTKPNGQPLPPGQTAIKVTAAIRKNFLKKPTDKATYSPNHVMVPAPNSDWCPFGGPSPADNPHRAPKGSEGVPITVIDAGYIWAPPLPGQPWGPTGSVNDNPLEQLAPGFTVTEADWLNLNGAGAVWQGGTHNIPDANLDHTLDALAGHANFVAGVIAQHSEQPQIHIWNHNSAFSYKQAAWDNFSTEAAICRSLVMSQQRQPTPVIQIGHETAVFQNIASTLWQIAFQWIGYGRHLDQDLILTCPAGNEGLQSTQIATTPRIPAAFGIPDVPTGASNPGLALIGPKYTWIKGVASHTGIRPSDFSNYGAWVTCSANGEQVLSSFLYVNMPTEEPPYPPSAAGAGHDFRPDSWAMWNGTSFAAPQVAGEIAAQLSPSVNAAQAWANLKMCAGCSFVPGYGNVFQF